ncbi:hypothetical protein [Leeia speluncae]|nr:hypothetical protein [Leeia speluncae]
MNARQTAILLILGFALMLIGASKISQASGMVSMICLTSDCASK